MKSTKDITTKRGFILRAGTEFKIVKTLINPMTKLKEHIILIDNGTGIEEFMPKDIISDYEMNKSFVVWTTI